MAHHHAFTMKVVTKQEPESFTKTARDPRWMQDMDEELQELGLRPFNTTILHHRLEGEEPKMLRKDQRKPEPDES